ncbi:MAG TPA: RNA polymerase sigma factor, partial [Pirellulales bacterium]
DRSPGTLSADVADVATSAATAGDSTIVRSPWSASLSDEELLSTYRASQSPRLFRELVQRYERPLYNYLRRYLNDAAMAEDVFQATFLAVHRKCEQFEAGRRVKPWLYAIATHCAIDATRRTRRFPLLGLEHESEELAEAGASRQPIDPSSVDPLVGLMHEEQQAWLHSAVERLPEGLRSVVEAVCLKGLPYQDAADALSIPLGTVKSRLHAAVKRLQGWAARLDGSDESEATATS